MLRGGVPVHRPPDATIAHVAEQGRKVLGPGGYAECGRLEWPALLRKLARNRGTAYLS